MVKYVFGVYGAVSGGSASLLFTNQLVKTDTSTVDAGAIPDALGLGFKQGDIPSGTWPQLKTTDGTSIPFTAWGENYWPDGSMRMVKVLPRIPDAITGTTGTAYDVEVWSGGSAPSTTTAMALSDAPDINNVLTGITNLSGTWTSSLAQGRTDADKVRILGQGPVGLYAGIGQEFMQSGSNHAHLECEHYVMILQDASGGVYGVRHIGHIMQPHAEVASPTYREFSAVKNNGVSSIRTLNGTDSGGVTHSTTITCAQYSGLMDCGTTAKMDFIAGTRGAEAPLRWQHDMSYWIKTKLLPPYDLSIGGIVSNTAVDYYPYHKGALLYYDMNTVGERGEIAAIDTFAARFIFNQSADDEQVIRCDGLVPAGWRQTIRRSTTRKPPVLNNGPDNAGGTYTGLGASEPTWYYKPGNGIANGINMPAADVSNWNAEDYTHHRPNTCYLPWLFTGEWQYLDLMTDFAIAGSYILQGTGSFNAMPWVAEPVSGVFRHHIINGTTYYSSCAFHEWGQPQREAAWNMRDIGQLVASLPAVDPAGTAIKDYYTDVLNSSVDAFLAFHALQSADWQGLNYFRGTADPYEAPWSHGYHLSAASLIAGATGLTNVLNYADYLLLYFKRIADRTTSYAQAFAYQARYRDETQALIYHFDDLMHSYLETVQVPDTTANTYTNTSDTLWTPTDGDRWAEFNSSLYTPILYVVNASGNTYQLSETLGGPPIDITNPAEIWELFLDPQNFSGSSYAFTGPDAYYSTITSAIRHAVAVGCSNVGNALTKAEAQVAIDPINYSGDPKVAYKASYS
jgi:hypothetical protein